MIFHDALQLDYIIKHDDMIQYNDFIWSKVLFCIYFYIEK